MLYILMSVYLYNVFIHASENLLCNKRLSIFFAKEIYVSIDSTNGEQKINEI